MNHFLHPPFSMAPRAAEIAQQAAIEKLIENAGTEGIVVDEQQARRLVESGEDWWESVETVRDFLAIQRMRLQKAGS